MPPSASTTAVETPLLLPEDAAEASRRLEHFLRHARQTPGVHSVEVDWEGKQPKLRVELDERSASLEDLSRWAEHAGIGLRERWGCVMLAVEGMASAQSAKAIEAALSTLPGVHASASFPSCTLRVEFDRAECQLADVALRLDKLGFRVEPLSKREADRRIARARVKTRIQKLGAAWSAARESPELIGAILGALALGSGILASRVFDAPQWIGLTFIFAAYPLAGWNTARDTLLTLAKFRFNIDVLMFVAAIGAAAIGHAEEGALLLVLFAFGHAGEHLAMDRARRAIEALGELAPDTAWRKKADGTTEEVRVQDLVVGDLVVIKPGERVPADGEVIAGYSSIDQAPITGESTPVEKSAGARVFAGTINGDGLLETRVDRAHTDTTLAKAIRLVEEAQTRKSPTELFTTKVERFYVPIVLCATALIFLIPSFVMGATGEAFATWFYRSMAFLTAASPCALAIGTPAAMLSALARAARLGVLIKGGAHLESLARLRAIAFDKTGTLTEGKPRIVGNETLGSAGVNDALFAAAAVETGSAHPLARAILDEALAQGWDGVEAESVTMVQGKGLRGDLRGATIEVGSRKLFADDARLPEAAIEAVDRMERELGATTVIVRRGSDYLGVLGLADPPRAESRASIDARRAMGVERQVMLTGDNEGAALAVSTAVGLDETHASLLPEEKLDLIGVLLEKYQRVAMVGDGVNDAPALAAATIGIAMGAAGSDAALETADVALLNDDLARLPEAISLAKFARRIVMQNLILALGVIVVLAPLAALGIASIGWAVVFHEGSTVLVVLNALRLLRWKPRV
jgi:Cd2+/Zn2+-exporting ATPase